MSPQFPQQQVVASTAKKFDQTVYHSHVWHTRIYPGASRQQIFRETEAFRSLFEWKGQVVPRLRLAQLHRIQQLVINLQALLHTISNIEHPMFIACEVPTDLTNTFRRYGDVPLTDGTKESCLNARTRAAHKQLKYRVIFNHTAS